MARSSSGWNSGGVMSAMGRPPPASAVCVVAEHVEQGVVRLGDAAVGHDHEAEEVGVEQTP